MPAGATYIRWNILALLHAAMFIPMRVNPFVLNVTKKLQSEGRGGQDLAFVRLSLVSTAAYDERVQYTTKGF